MKKNFKRYILIQKFIFLIVFFAIDKGNAETITGQPLKTHDLSVEQAKILLKEILKSSQGQERLHTKIKMHQSLRAGTAKKKKPCFDLDGFTIDCAQDLITSAIDHGELEKQSEYDIKIYWEAPLNQVQKFGAKKRQLYIGTYPMPRGMEGKTRKVAVVFSLEGIKYHKASLGQIDLKNIVQQIHEKRRGSFKTFYPIKPTRYAKKDW